MIAVGIALLTVVVAGLPLALAADRRSRGPRLLGTSFLFGCGSVSFVLFALSFAGRWWLPTVVMGLFVVASAGWLLRLRNPQAELHDMAPSTILSWIVDGALAVSIAGHLRYATLAPLGEWDFWAIWGLKARVFWEHGGIDWAFLQNPDNSFAHTDYPPLLPLNFAFLTFAQGEWSDRWLGIFFTAFLAAGLLIVRDLIRRDIRSPYLAALATLAIAGPLLSTPLGLGDGLVAVASGCGFLFVRRAILDADPVHFRTGAILLGIGALSKNEGLAFLVAVTAAVVLTAARDRFRTALRLWPAYAIAATWLVPRAFASLATDLFSGATLGERIVQKVRSFPVLLDALATNLPAYPWFWAGVIVAFAIAGSKAVSRERLALMTVCIQLLFYIGSYIASPHDPSWHVLHSWRRLVEHLVLPAAVPAFALVAAMIERENSGEVTHEGNEAAAHA